MAGLRETLETITERIAPLQIINKPKPAPEPRFNFIKINDRYDVEALYRGDIVVLNGAAGQWVGKVVRVYVYAFSVHVELEPIANRKGVIFAQTTWKVSDSSVSAVLNRQQRASYLYSLYRYATFSNGMVQ